MERVREGVTRRASRSARRRSDTAGPHCRGRSSRRVPTTLDHVRIGRNDTRRSGRHRKFRRCPARPPGSGADARRGRRTLVHIRPRGRHAQPGRAPRRSRRRSTPEPKRAGATLVCPARCASQQGIGPGSGRQEWPGAGGFPAFLAVCVPRGGTLQALLIACACILLPGHWIHPSTAGRALGITFAKLLHGRRERAQRGDYTGCRDIHSSIVQDQLPRLQERRRLIQRPPPTIGRGRSPLIDHRAASRRPTGGSFDPLRQASFPERDRNPLATRLDNTVAQVFGSSIQRRRAWAEVTRKPGISRKSARARCSA